MPNDSPWHCEPHLSRVYSVAFELRARAVTIGDSNLWEDLIYAIEDRHVVPIVGAQLLVIDTQDGPQLFHHMVAERLAAELNVSTEHLPESFDINAVVCAYQNFHGDPLAVRPRLVRRILDEIKVPLPEPLRLLAEIPNFQLFVSTSFDTLLEETILSIWHRAPAVIAYPSASNLIDYDDSLLEDSGKVVFQVFGRATASSEFAATEGQMLEQMHELMAGESRPRKLIAKLQQSNLLILGVGFPDWLARFLLRVARTNPLWYPRTKMEVIADGNRTQPEFIQFLHRFSPQQSHICAEGSPTDFVRELHRRWFERHPKSAPAKASDPNATRPPEMKSGSVFISYAHEDHEVAFRLADQLAGAGLEIWIDRRLNPGDDFQNVIVQYIRDSCAFVPLISQNTQSDLPRWFRKEWAQACEIAGSFYGTDRKFLFPVVIDETPYNSLVEMRRNTFGRTAVRAVDGEPPAELMSELDAAQKDYRRRFARR